MTKLVMLITKPPHSDEGAQRMCGIAQRANLRDMDVTIYFIGDGVLCAKKDQAGFVGKHMKESLKNGVILKACANDLKARAIPPEQVEPGVEVLEDFENIFIDDIMEHADRVISW